MFKKHLKLSAEGLSIHSSKLFLQIDDVAVGNHLGPTSTDWFLGMIKKENF